MGRLLSWDPDTRLLRVEKRDGTVVDVPEADLVAAKVVPEALPTRHAPGRPATPPQDTPPQ